MKYFFNHWHPEVALRYLPIVEEIKKSGIKNPSVLEVGSGSLGIAPYLDLQVTGIDINFSGPQFPLLRQVKGETTSLPFPDNSFDFVILVDVLEHLSSNNRPKAISETLRCAQKKVFIATPSGEKAFNQDKNLSNYYIKVFGKVFSYFSDHFKYGLPEKNWVSDKIKIEARNLGKKVEITTFGNENLALREFLMWGWITKNPIVDIIFQKVFLLFIPIFKHMNQKPTYRQIFFVKII